MSLHVVIMAGGAGTRFWPASRAACPKQLLALTGGPTLIQSTAVRLAGLVPLERVLVVTNRQLVASIRQQLPDLPPDAVVGEPCKRDTAPCIGLAAGMIVDLDPLATMAVMPADHVIQPAETFRAALVQAAAVADAEPSRIITFGVRPSYPAESFGYIERGESLGSGVYRVRHFHEKPTVETARAYVESGNFFWNSGIFVWRAATVLEALRRFEPVMFEHLERIRSAHGTPAFGATLEREFSAIRGRSIDYAVMEHYEDVAVIEAPFAWDDVGNWRALARLAGADEAGNTQVGRCLALDTQRSILRSDSDHLLVALGLADIIVVHTPDATLVAHKDREESLRKVVEVLTERGWTQYL